MSRRVAMASVAVLAAAALGASVIALVRSGGSGPAWSAPVTLAPGRLVGGVQAATSADGTTTAVWDERRGQTWALMSADRPLGGPWSAPTPIVAPQPWRFQGVSLAVGLRGDAAVSFSFSSRSRAVLLASFRPAGGRWEKPQTIAPVVGGYYAPRTAVGPDGDAVVAWSAPFGPRGVISASRHSASGWSDPTEVLDAGGVQNAPALGVGPRGEAILAAVTNRGRLSNPHLRLAVARSARGGAPWTRMPLADPSVAASAQPAILIDEAGSPSLVWARPAPGGAALVVSRAQAGAWGAPSELDRGPRDGFGSVVAQPAGTALVTAWTRWVTPGTRETVRAAFVGADGSPSAAHALDTFTLPGARTGPGTYTGPPSAALALAGGESPTVVWARQVTRDPVSTSDIVSASADRSGRWSRATVVSGRALSSWPLSAGSVAGARVASWATLTNPNGGPIDVSVSQWGHRP